MTAIVLVLFISIIIIIIIILILIIILIIRPQAHHVLALHLQHHDATSPSAG
jgi:hypothetical protein